MISFRKGMERKAIKGLKIYFLGKNFFTGINQSQEDKLHIFFLCVNNIHQEIRDRNSPRDEIANQYIKTPSAAVSKQHELNRP